MKNTLRLTTLAIAAVTFTGVLAAQGRNDSRGSSRAAAPRGGSSARAPMPQHNMAARPEPRGRADFGNRTINRVDNRGDFRGFNNRGAETRGFDNRGFDNRGFDNRARVDVRDRVNFRAPVEHGRPLITRAGYAYRTPVYGGGGFRYWRGVDRFGVRIALPSFWYRPLYVNGYFPSAYFGYCEAVPYDLDYMLPPMYGGYNSCLIGDRIVVYDRFSRGISFVAVIP